MKSFLYQDLLVINQFHNSFLKILPGFLRLRNYLMINIRMQKIISLKLNGLRVHGQDINQREEKIKEVLRVMMLKN